MSIKETFKKIAAGASVIGMTTAFGCGDKKEEAPIVEQPTPVVKTVEKEEKCYISDSDYKEMCKNMGSETRLVDFGSRERGYGNKTCNIVEKAEVVDTEEDKLSAAYTGLCKGRDDVDLGDDNVTFTCKVEKESPCKEKNDRIQGDYRVKITYANLVPLCQDLARQCEERENCKCGTKKDANGCVSCVEEEPGIYYIKDDTGKEHKDHNAYVYGSMHEALVFAFDRHGEEYEGGDVTDVGGPEGGPVYLASEPQKCPDDKDKYCLTDHNITFKFKVKNMSQAKKECDAQCSKIGAECGYLGDRVNLAEGYNCNITDELYDKCKVKCAKQDSEPTQTRNEFDGHCKCDNGEEPIVETEQKTESQLATKPERIADDERVQEAQKQIEETAKKSELKSMSHAEAAQTPEEICYEYLGSKYKKGVCTFPVKKEPMYGRAGLEKKFKKCQINEIIAGKGNTATVHAVCSGVPSIINVKRYYQKGR